MRFCRSHNKFYPERHTTCPDCVERTLREAGRLPYRVTNPPVHPRCIEPEGCGNLLPVCTCDLRGSLTLPGFPGLRAPQ